MSTDELVVVSNLAVAIVTFGAIFTTFYTTFKEAHRHEEYIVKAEEDATKRMTEVVHEVLIQEKTDAEQALEAEQKAASK